MADNTQPIGVIARLLDLSERRVQQLSREGVIPKAERGRYELVGAVRGYIHYLRDLALKADKGIPDYGAERARLIKARADLTEMEAQQKHGELIPSDQVQEAWVNVVSKVRARLLVLPDKLAPMVYEAAHLSDAKAAIKSGVWEALEDLSDTDVIIDTTDGAPKPQGPDTGDPRGPEAAA